VTLKGRFGIVLPRFDGPTLLQLLLTGAMTSEQVGAILATLYLSVHKTPPAGGRSLPSRLDRRRVAELWHAAMAKGGEELGKLTLQRQVHH
jgi:hypothetical protein